MEGTERDGYGEKQVEEELERAGMGKVKEKGLGKGVKGTDRIGKGGKGHGRYVRG